MKLIAAPDKFCVWKRELMNMIPFTKTRKQAGAVHDVQR